MKIKLRFSIFDKHTCNLRIIGALSFRVKQCGMKIIKILNLNFFMFLFMEKLKKKFWESLFQVDFTMNSNCFQKPNNFTIKISCTYTLELKL